MTVTLGFDVYGTLIDTAEDIAIALNRSGFASNGDGGRGLQRFVRQAHLADW